MAAVAWGTIIIFIIISLSIGKGSTKGFKPVRGICGKAGGAAYGSVDSLRSQTAFWDIII